MTYIELVNNVLRRMREGTVTGVNDTEYSRLIGDLVNDALETVEDSYNWGSNRSEAAVTFGVNGRGTTAGADRATVDNVYDPSQRTFLQYRPREWFQSQGPLVGTPQYYGTFQSANNALVLEVYPTPAADYDLDVAINLGNTRLVLDSDTTFLPTSPIIHLAAAYAVSERGDNGGTTMQEYLARYKQSLSDAIAFEAARRPEEQIWYS